jgi:hypothetical protein
VVVVGLNVKPLLIVPLSPITVDHEKTLYAELPITFTISVVSPLQIVSEEELNAINGGTETVAVTGVNNERQIFENFQL